MTTDTTGAAPPPPAATPRRLVRRRSDRYIAGVAGGIADHLGVDPLLVRIAFAALVFAGGLGFVLYVAGWLLIPEDGGTAVLGRDAFNRLGGRSRSARVVVGVVLLAIAAGVLVDSLGAVHSGLVWGAILVGVGVLLLVEEGWQPLESRLSLRSAGPPAASAAYGSAGVAPAPPMDRPASPAEEAAAIEPAGLEAARPDETARASAASAAAPPRRRSLLGWITVGAALLTLGVATLLDSAGVVTVGPGSALALVLLVIGAGLVVGTWLGRSRALMVLGVALLPFAATASLVKEPLDAGTGDRLADPASPTALLADYRLTAGHLTLDLSRLPALPGERTVTAHLAFGALDVTVPESLPVDVTAHAGAGHLDVLGHQDSGVGVDAHVPSAGAGGPVLHLDLSTGMGQVRVIRAVAASRP